jgi:DNA-binding transcriptional ArsR family regulator
VTAAHAGLAGPDPDSAGAAVPDSLDRTLSALADPARRQVVELLRERPHRAGELAAALSVSPSVMSRHLKVLRDSDLVEEASPAFDTRVRVYSLRAGATAGLRSWLEAVEQGWAEQLTALKAHVERSG